MPSLTEDKTQTYQDTEYKQRLEEYFLDSPGSNVEKLENFAKFVPRQSMTRFLVKYELFQRILTVHGSIIECGVFLGGGLMSWAALSSILEPVNHQRRIIGFDTFSGIPGLSEEDLSGDSDRCRVGELAADAYEDLRRCIDVFDQNRALSHIPKVELVRGDMTETIGQFLSDNPHTVVSLLYLDAVVFEPTMAALQNFRPRIPKGGIIVFDELNSPLWHGETIAVLREVGIENLRIQRFPFDSALSYAIVE